MNPIHEVIKNEIVKPMLQEQVYIASGYILDYNSRYNTAIIEYMHPHTGDRVHMRNVVVSRPPFGFHPAEPRAGDRITVGFEGGNVHRPRVLEYFDERYHREHADGPFKNLTVIYATTVPDLLSYI